MRKHLRTGMCALAGLVFCADALAIAPEPTTTNRYLAIPERNAFGLKPPPSSEPPPPTPPSLPKLILTGITTILGNKRVLLKAQPVTNAPGQQAKEESLILTEGQREGNIEVLNIDEKAGSVRVNNSGTIMTLTFEKDGAKLPNTPLPQTLLSPTNANLLPPATLPTALPVRGAGTNFQSLPRRNIRSSGRFGAAPPAVPANPIGGVSSAPVPPVPSTAASLPQDLTPEEQAIVQELQRQAATVPGDTSPTQATLPGNVLPLPQPQAPVLPQ